MILVVGATGILGGIIAHNLLAQARQVRVLLRQNSPAEQMAVQGMATSPQSLVEAGAEPVYGDLKDRASLHAAVEGVETLITTANSALRGGEDNTETVDLEGNRNLIEAARDAGVQHFIFVSALGADANSPVPLMRSKGMTEELLRASGLTYTILSPNIFMDIWFPAVVLGPALGGHPVVLVGEGKRRHSFIAIQDVAAFALAAVDNPAAHNAFLPIGGPEPLSWRDVVATAEQVLGREIPVQTVAPGEAIPHLPDVMVGLLTAQDSYESPLDMAQLASSYEVNLTSAADFIRRFAGGG